MEEHDLLSFTQLIHQFHKVSKERNKPLPDNDVVEFYFEALKDKSLEEIRANGQAHFIRGSGFFPTVAELRNDPDPEQEARVVFDIVQNLMDTYFVPGFPGTLDAVYRRLKRRGLGHVVPMIERYGLEIINRENITATRSQFVKSYETYRTHPHLAAIASGEKQPLPVGEIAKKLTGGK